MQLLNVERDLLDVCNIWRAKAPGSVMIMGEHSVLDGGSCMVMAIASYATVTWYPQCTNGQWLDVHSNHFGHSRTFTQDQQGYNWLWEIVQRLDLPLPLVCVIDVDHSPTLGWGSSGAVLAAAVASALHWHDGKKPTVDACLTLAWSILHSTRPLCSGADVSASVLGGMVWHTVHHSIMHHPIQHRVSCTPMAADHSLKGWFYAYSGVKTPTEHVVQWVKRCYESSPERVQCIFKRLQHITQMAYHALHDIPTFGAYMADHHHGQCALGTMNAALAKLIQRYQHPSIFVKISGAGLGDGIIGLNASNMVLNNVYHLIPCQPYLNLLNSG
jgi:mevalonate kinase